LEFLSYLLENKRCLICSQHTGLSSDVIWLYKRLGYSVGN
jgi:hypothetical protein